MMVERRRSSARPCSSPAGSRRIPLLSGIVVLFLVTNLHAAALADPPVPVPPVGDVPSVPPAGETVGDAVDQAGDAVDDATGDGGDAPAGAGSSAPEASADADVHVQVGGGSGHSQGGSTPPSGAGSPAGPTPGQSGTSGGSSGSNASVAEVNMGGQPIAGVGQTEAHQGNGHSGAGASSLSALGHEVTGTHSSSSGASSSQATSGLLAHAVCDGTNGSLCLGLLYEQASSGPDGARADGVLVGACLGGQSDPTAACHGPLGVTIGQSSSSATGYSSTLLGACFGGHGDGTTPCSGIGTTVLAADETAGGDRKEIGAVLEVGGRQLLSIGHPDAIPSCSRFLNTCATFNEGGIGESENTPSDGGGAGTGQASAYADGAVVQVALGGSDIAGVSETGAAADDDGSSSDATVVSVLGHEVIGAHAAAEDGSSESETGYLTESCDASRGWLCAALLFGHAAASANGDGSQGSSDSALASVCLFGDQRDPSEPCDGTIGAAALESHSDAYADNDPGTASSDQWSNVGDICLGGENDSEKCDGLGAELIHSESHSSAATDSPAASASDSSLVDVESGGDDAVSVDGETEIPAECTDNASLACVVLNDVATGAAAGSSSGSATAAAVGLVTEDGGNALVGGGIGESSTGAGVADDVPGEDAELPDDDLDGDDPENPVDSDGDGPGGDGPGGDGPGGDDPGGDDPGGDGSADDTDGSQPEDENVGAENGISGGEVAGSGASNAGSEVLGAAQARSGIAGGRLPFTGTSPSVPVAAGLIMMAAGLLLLTIARARRY